MLISLLILLLISNAVTTRQDKSILFSRVAIIGLVYTSFLASNNLFTKPLEKGIGLYGGLFNVSTFTHSFNIFILLVSAVILTLTAFYPRKVFVPEHSSLYDIAFKRFTYNKDVISNKKAEQFCIIEYALIIVFVLCGAVFLISSADLVSVFLSIELQSYGLYILSTLYRDSELATGSGLTYFLLGGLSSCFILLGSALLYANSGTTSLDNIYIITSISDLGVLSNIHNLYDSQYINMSLIIMSVGLLFKVSAAPFHFWSPDVYDGIPTIVTTYVAIIAKISIFAFVLELVYYTDHYFFDFSWKNILVLSSLFSLIIGSVLGLTQFRIKRLFAYSTISHVGFILLALSINTAESIQSFIFYILQYSLSNLNAFIILITIGYTLYLYTYNKPEYKQQLTDENNSPIQLINQIKGYFHINPFLAISLSITLFSFVGVPPAIGFFAKQMILSAAIDNGYVFMALIAILTSVIGAVYYLNIVRQIFFYKEDYITNPLLSSLSKEDNDYYLQAYISSYNNDISSTLSYSEENIRRVSFKLENITINSSLSASISLITLLLILFIYMPSQWFNVANILTIIIFKA